MVGYHLYADDSQIYITASPEEIDTALTRMEECVSAVGTWMSGYHLKMNNRKTEYLVISSKPTARHIQPQPLDVCGHPIVPSTKAKNIGVIFDSNMTMEAHVSLMCRNAYGQLYRLSKVRKYMDRRSFECLIHAFISTRLDYCNAILCGASQQLKTKLQRVQNAAARILVGNVRKYDPITPTLKEIHWLPVPKRIEFKILLLTFKCIQGLAPSYLSELLKEYNSNNAFTLRTAHQSLLNVPFTRSDFIQTNAFSFVAPRLFNQLPFYIRSSASVDIFKSRLKTHLFKQHFDVI
eukprot:GHVO01063386.1.p1 GENE.GHVO01063386.1~~GHVO01063386.1.p1  ORF type:complete len:293 (+),score=11.57 GHVO01063386.1:110-988(+)